MKGIFSKQNTWFPIRPFAKNVFPCVMVILAIVIYGDVA